MEKQPVRRVNVVKITVFPKMIHGFDATLIEIPAGHCAEIDKLILQLLGKFTESK